MRDRVKKGDYVIELRGREGTYRLHAQKGVVAEPVMERIADHIARLGAWAVRVGDENWPLPEPPKEFASEDEQAEILEAIDAAYANHAPARSPAVDDETVKLSRDLARAVGEYRGWANGSTRATTIAAIGAEAMTHLDTIARACDALTDAIYAARRSPDSVPEANNG